MPFPSSICTKTTSEAKIIQLRSFSVGSASVVPIVLEDTSFAILFDSLDFEVLEHVNSAPWDQLQKNQKFQNYTGNLDEVIIINLHWLEGKLMDFRPSWGTWLSS